jgi:hypothetical protein
MPKPDAETQHIKSTASQYAAKINASATCSTLHEFLAHRFGLISFSRSTLVRLE